VCRELHIKPGSSTYSLSVDQLMNYPSGEIKQIIVDKQIKANYDSDSLVIAEEDNPNNFGFLKFMVTDILGVGQRLYVPSFDITKYDINGSPIPVIIDQKKVKDKLSKMTSDNSNYWWIVIMLILFVVICIPIGLYVYATTLDN
jgi:hypothetical protein